MILKALTLENFKGIGEPVRIEFAPLTLLFGPNNAGKSTIVQALMYAREVLERNNCDARKTELGGDAVDLGGFLNLVHGNDRERVIQMRFELDLSLGSGYQPRFTERPRDSTQSGGFFHHHDGLNVDPAQDLRQADLDAESAVQERGLCWVEVRVGMLGGHSPTVLSYAVGEDSEPYATISIKDPHEGSGAVRAGWNSLTLDFTARPFVRKSDASSDCLFESWMRTQIQSILKAHCVPSANGHSFAIITGRYGRKDCALPDWSGELRIPDAFRAGEVERVRREPNVWASYDVERTLGVLRVLREIIVAPGACLVDALRGSIFLSAQRAMPARDHHSKDMLSTVSWWNGLAAWDELIDDSRDLVRRVNAWLADPKAFDSGHEVSVERYIEVSATDPNVEKLRNSTCGAEIDLPALKDTLFGLPEERRLLIKNFRSGARIAPRDVGAGLSQVIPVIVAALRIRDGLTALEEPESKMHPAYQMVLADLLLYAASGAPREEFLRGVKAPLANRIRQSSGRPWFIVETHSEHLMLRCLRRIRETGKGLLPSGIPSVSPGDVAVHFVNPGPDGARIKRIEIDEDGDFIDEWPGGFFEESFNEKFAGR